MATRMQQRRGTAAQWAVANPVLSDGELGYEKDTGIVKVGNGTSTWNQLSPILTGQFLGVNAKAADAERLDGLDSTAFLLATGKAVDADKLDGIDSTGFKQLTLPTITSTTRPTTGIIAYKPYRETDTGDIVAWDPVTSKWTKVGGEPRILLDKNNGPSSGTVNNGTVSVKACRYDTGVHTAGVLRIKWNGQWWSSANAAVIWSLGVAPAGPGDPTTVVFGSGSRSHNHGVTTIYPPFDCEGIWKSDGSSVAIFLLGSPDAGGGNVNIAENSCTVWLEALPLI